MFKCCSSYELDLKFNIHFIDYCLTNAVVLCQERYWRTPYPFRPIPRAPEGTSSSTPVAANIAVPASQANLTACTSTFLSQRGDTSSLPPKGDPPSEEEDLELTVAPPSQQQNMTNMSSQNAVGVIQVI